MATEDRYIIKLKTKVSESPVNSDELANREIVLGNYEKVFHIKDDDGIMHKFEPVSDTSVSYHKTWSSKRITDYIDDVIGSTIIDLSGTYTKSQIDNLLITKSDLSHTQPSTSILNDSVVTGATVKDALNSLQTLVESTQSSSYVIIQVSNNSGINIFKGQPVRLTTFANQVVLAVATTIDDADILGIAFEDIPNGTSGNVIKDGIINATTSEWEKAIDTSTSLIVGENYYLSSAITGKLTITPPQGPNEVLVLIGKAASLTKMVMTMNPPILL